MRLRAAGAWISTSRSISNPFVRRRSIHSPWARWNSTPPSGHSIRCKPNCGRCNDSLAGTSSSEQRITSVELRRNTSRPPGRSSRAASGIQRYGSTQIDAPNSETTRSKLAPGRPVSAASASTRGTRSRSRPSCGGPLELCGCDVDADRPSAELGEPRGEVRRAAAELADVEAVDVTEHVQLRLVDAPDAPA